MVQKFEQCPSTYLGDGRADIVDHGLDKARFRLNLLQRLGQFPERLHETISRVIQVTVEVPCARITAAGLAYLDKLHGRLQNRLQVGENFRLITGAGSAGRTADSVGHQGLNTNKENQSQNQNQTQFNNNKIHKEIGHDISNKQTKYK